jgi:DNA-binding FadR family transcriptional regulator
MAIQYQPIVTESVSKQIAEKIRDSIVDGRLQADDRLPTEAELARQFEVSRPTVREALKRLAAQNLIRSRRGPTGGTFVNRPSQEEIGAHLTTATTLMVTLGEFDLNDIAEARLELELLCVRLAAERRDDGHLERMAAEIERQKDPAISDETFCASDVGFHRALVDASRNPVLQFAMYAVIEALQPLENMIIFRFRERHRIVEQHQRILDALRAQDADAAAAAVAAQMTYLRAQFAQARDSRRKRKKA